MGVSNHTATLLDKTNTFAWPFDKSIKVIQKHRLNLSGMKTLRFHFYVSRTVLTSFLESPRRQREVLLGEAKTSTLGEVKLPRPSFHMRRRWGSF